jgi:ribonuclease P protein component
MSGERLRPWERIRRRPEFERVYNQGVRIQARFMTLFVLPNAGDAARLGVAATRKLGSAVIRNRAKRLAREVFRRSKDRTGLDIVIVPRLGMLDASFATLQHDLEQALARTGRSSGTTARHEPAVRPRPARGI